MKRLLVAVLTTLLLVTPAIADVVKTVRTEYYSVDGKNARDIFAYLKKHSPLNKGDSTYQAHTRTKVKTQYKMVRRGNMCSVKNVVIYLDLTYLYPRLKHSVDRKTRNWWKDFIGKLEEHELIHGQISIKAAHRLNDELEAVQSSNCAGFNEAVKLKAKQILTQMKKDQVLYDKLTEHGLRQERNRGRYP